MIIEHKKSPVIQEDDYYPFGLTFNEYKRENSVINKIKFQGQEHIDDLDLGWDSFKWRNHMPDIGRFFNIDPLAEKYLYNSPYAFSENQVVAHVELEGLEKVSIQQSLNSNSNFLKTYNIQRQTSGGKAFTQAVENQKKVNVLYVTFKGEEDQGGFSQRFKNTQDFKEQSADDPYFAQLSEEEVESAMDGNNLLMIAINETNLKDNDIKLLGASMSLNHEEVAHGSGFLQDDYMKDGREQEDHENIMVEELQLHLFQRKS